MSRPRMRPLLRAHVNLPRAELMARLVRALEAPGAPVVGQHSIRQLILQLPPGQRRFFSPTLDLNLIDDGEAVQLCGRYGPQPDIWGLFLGLYAVSLFSTLAGLVLGSSQALLDLPPWGLLVALGSAAFGGLLYLGSFVGQRLSAHQMHVLGDFLAEAAGAPIQPEPGA